ncbi:MAG: endonuclease/exonuclease/phosphatase family protein [Chlorobiaceae bacterium]
MRRSLHCLFLLLIALTGIARRCEADSGKNQEVLFMWWNVENLFDTVNDPATRDDDFTPAGKMNWTGKRLALKEMRIRYILSAIEANRDYRKFPDVLAFAEVENLKLFEETLRGFRGISYSIIYHETPDPRGIDIGLAFNPRTITSSGSKAYTVNLHGAPTRKIIVAGLSIKGHPFHVVLNHWPSRAFDASWSEEKRLIAASVARHIIDSLRIASPAAAIVVMGDFNDEPANRSIRDALGSSFSREKVRAGGDRLLYNCWSGYKGIGSYYFHGHWQQIDQVLLSKGMLLNRGLSYHDGDFRCLAFSRMLVPAGKMPWSTYNKRTYSGGYSDHLPLLLKARIEP